GPAVRTNRVWKSIQALSERQVSRTRTHLPVDGHHSSRPPPGCLPGRHHDRIGGDRRKPLSKRFERQSKTGHEASETAVPPAYVCAGEEMPSQQPRTRAPRDPNTRRGPTSPG